jgi:hypothetical protein
MMPLTEPEIRASFVNCSKGEAKRLTLPRDLAEQPWEDLDFLGWRDPRAPERAYLVTEVDGGPLGVALRCPTPSTRLPRRNLCSFCLTSPAGGVVLMVAPRAGKQGQQGNSVGTYICADLACSLYVRGLKDPGPGGRVPESMSQEEQAERTAANVAGFVASVGA